MDRASINTSPLTPGGQPYGWIDCNQLRELWIHTGTACNLRCPTCFEQAGPGNGRLQAPEIEEIRNYADQALRIGVGQFGVTGGEPFLHRDIVDFLAVLVERAPCLVLSNGTGPLLGRLDALRGLRGANPKLSFRISLDYAEKDRHEAGRGGGTFLQALNSIRSLLDMGFPVSVARRREADENAAVTAAKFQELFIGSGLPENLPVTAFPDLQPENAPHISENCMTTYHNEASRAGFMCAYSRMLVKRDGRMRVCACTLVDDDPRFDFGPELSAAAIRRTFLGHKRCFACFSGGVACGNSGG